MHRSLSLRFLPCGLSHFVTLLFAIGIGLQSAANAESAHAEIAFNKLPGMASHEMPLKAEASTRPSKKWLRTSRGARGVHQLVVDRFDKDRGLLASYEAPNGDRLLFRAAFVAPNVSYAETLYYDEDTGKVERLFPMVSPEERVGKRKDALTVQEIASTLNQLAGKQAVDLSTQWNTE